MNYVRAIVDHGVSLRAGAIYSMLPPESNDGDLLRIADETMGEAGSEGGYLYPADFIHRQVRAEKGRKGLTHTYDHSIMD